MNTWDAPKPICKRSKPISPVFIVLLFLAGFAWAPVFGDGAPDNAQWAQQTLAQKNILPDSLVPGAAVCLRQGSPNELNPLVRQALIQSFSRQNDRRIFLSCDSSDSGEGFVLEFQIVCLKVDFLPSPEKFWSRRPTFRRRLQYQIDLNLVSQNPEQILWTGSIRGQAEEQLLRKDMEDTRSVIYPCLDSRLRPLPGSTIFNALILLGTAGGLIYFLYK